MGPSVAIHLGGGKSNMAKAMGDQKPKSSGPMQLDRVVIEPKKILLDGKETTVYEVEIMKVKKDKGGQRLWDVGDSSCTKKAFTSVDEAMKHIASELGATPAEDETGSETENEVDTESEDE